jgi:hypothetical protein
MKAPAMLIGIALIALGLIALVYQGITYTTREKDYFLSASALAAMSLGAIDGIMGSGRPRPCARFSNRQDSEPRAASGSKTG